MRAGVQVGDEIVTIGGICCKVVKTKEETIVVQAGPDKIKIELMRWAVSKIVKEGSGRVEKSSVDDFDEVSDAEEQQTRKSKPKRMKKAAVVEEPEAAADEAADAAEEKADAVEDKADEAVEEKADEAVEKTEDAE